MRRLGTEDDSPQGSDACGILLLSEPRCATNRLLTMAKYAMGKLAHRGGRLIKDDEVYGDGAGLKFRIPIPFVRKILGARGNSVVDGRLAIGQFLLPADAGKYRVCVEAIDSAVKAEKLRLITWRKVPVESSVLPRLLREIEPLTRQIVLELPGDLTAAELHTAMFKLKRRIDKALRGRGITADEAYIVSLGREIVYKGMYTPEQLFGYYGEDLESELMVTDGLLGHVRYATYAKPKHRLAQPFEIDANGEVTSVEALTDWFRSLEMAAAASDSDSPYLGFQPLDGSDTMIVDAQIAALMASTGLPLDAVVEMVFTRACQNDPEMSPAFRKRTLRNSVYARPATGPSLINGLSQDVILAKRDPNAYRPSWWATVEGGLFYLASEPLLFPDIPEEKIKQTGTLEAGEMIARIGDGPVLTDHQLQDRWLGLPFDEALPLETVAFVPNPEAEDEAATLSEMAVKLDPWNMAGRQGYSADFITTVLVPEANSGQPAAYSMGMDAMARTLTSALLPLVAYLRLRFRQVVAPAMDSKNERDVVELVSIVRSIGSPFDPKLTPGKAWFFDSPFVRPSTMRDIMDGKLGIRLGTLRAVYEASNGPEGLKARLDALCTEAEKLVLGGAELLVVLNAIENDDEIGVPGFIVAGRLHEYLSEKGLRLKAGLLVETEAIDGFGCGAVVDAGAELVWPRLAVSLLLTPSAKELLSRPGKDDFMSADHNVRIRNWYDAVEQNLRDDMGRLCVTAVEAYRGGANHSWQFGKEVTTDCAPHWHSPTGGPGWNDLGAELLAFRAVASEGGHKKDTGVFKSKGVPPSVKRAHETLLQGGEPHPIDENDHDTDTVPHAWNPTVIKVLQEAAMCDDEVPEGELVSPRAKEIFRRYTRLTWDNAPAYMLHHGWRIKQEFLPAVPLGLHEVPSLALIMSRFRISDISIGAIGQGPHTTGDIAGNRLNRYIRSQLGDTAPAWVGFGSGTGEGGFDPGSFERHPKDDPFIKAQILRGKKGGDWKFQPDDDCGAYYIQVGSGRFGLTPELLSWAREVIDKGNQGAKPGKGGRVSGRKINRWSADLRRVEEGQTLSSPGNHHDRYSVEDWVLVLNAFRRLAPNARIVAKIVMQPDIASVVLALIKAGYDDVLIASSEGGTGNATVSDIQYSGFSWHGLTEVQDALIAAGVRDRVRILMDGRVMTPHDIIMSGLLCADGWGLGTYSLVAAMGCIKANVCQEGKCPRGLATTDQDLIEAQFIGRPEYLVNAVVLMAMGVQELMARYGFRTFEDFIGRSYMLEQYTRPDCPKLDQHDSSVLFTKYGPEYTGPRLHGRDNPKPIVDDSVDLAMLAAAEQVIETGTGEATVSARLGNEQLNIGGILSNRIVTDFGDEGIDNGRILLRTTGVAGGGFGLGLVNGVEIHHEGWCASLMGQIVVGGVISARLPRHLDSGRNVIGLDSYFYGATRPFRSPKGTGVRAYLAGRVGVRFGIRLSDGVLVCEGTGRSAANFMSGGLVILLGETGRNVGAGMSGGKVLVYDEFGHFVRHRRNNTDYTRTRPLDEADEHVLRLQMEAHVRYTESLRVEKMLTDWDEHRNRFVVVESIMKCEPTKASLPLVSA